MCVFIHQRIENLCKLIGFCFENSSFEFKESKIVYLFIHSTIFHWLLPIFSYQYWQMQYVCGVGKIEKV